MLTAAKGREILRTVQTLIVDEIHAIADDKRGSHLALSIARLEALTGRPVQKIGLSATVSPIEEVARFLSPQAHIIQVGHRRAMELGVEVPRRDDAVLARNDERVLLRRVQLDGDLALDEPQRVPRGPENRRRATEEGSISEGSAGS